MLHVAPPINPSPQNVEISLEVIEEYFLLFVGALDLVIGNAGLQVLFVSFRLLPSFQKDLENLIVVLQ